MRIKLRSRFPYYAIGLTLLYGVWALGPGQPQFIGVVLALPMAFFVPGYLLVDLLFQERPLEVLHHVTLGVGISIAIDILGGFLLNALPWGLDAHTWMLYLGGLTLIFSLLEIFFRDPLPESPQPEVPHLLAHLRFSTIIGVFCLVLAAGLMLYTLRYSMNSQQNQRRQGFTELWMIQANPRNKSCAVDIGFTSFELSPMTFNVVMTINGVQAHSWSSLKLAPQKTWQTSLPVTSPTDTDQAIDVQLFRTSAPGTAYRDVHLVLHQQSGQCTT